MIDPDSWRATKELMQPTRDRVDWAYLAANYEGLVVVDVSEPAKPREISHAKQPRSARTVQVAGDYAWVGDYAAVHVFDISNPAAPRAIAKHDIPAQVARVIVAENGTAHVAAYEAGLMVFALEAETKEAETN